MEAMFKVCRLYAELLKLCPWRSPNNNSLTLSLSLSLSLFVSLSLSHSLTLSRIESLKPPLSRPFPLSLSLSLSLRTSSDCCCSFTQHSLPSPVYLSNLNPIFIYTHLSLSLVHTDLRLQQSFFPLTVTFKRVFFSHESFLDFDSCWKVMMNTAGSRSPSEPPFFPSFHKNKKMEMQRCISKAAEKPIANRRISRRERKFALLQDVDKLKKKLRQEESIHRALERAFSRRLGTLPHLPPYLPPQTLELLAEVAVLEEEVVRLEEEVVCFRQGLYQEAVYLSSRISTVNSGNNPFDQPIKSATCKHDGSRSSMSPVEVDSGQSKPPQPQSKPLNSLSRSASSRLSYPHREGSDFLNRSIDGKQYDFKKPDSSMGEGGVLGKENHSSSDSNSKPKNSPEKLALEAPNSVKTPSIKPETAEKGNPPKVQNGSVDQERAQESCSSSSSGDRISEAESEANKVSENVLKCLFGIFLRLSRLKAKTMDSEAFSNLMSLALTKGGRETAFRDPYGICLKSKKRDIGPYKHLFSIEAGSIDFKKKSNASLLIRRLKLLLGKLASVNLEDMTQQQKLAFWINVYNICMMNAYLEHGIPDNPEMVVTLMQKATINAGGHSLNAATIEHLILRLPCRLKHTCSKSPEKDEIEIHKKFGLEWSEPLVTFALCSGSWSSPAVRVYTATQVEHELAIAKRDYLQAAFGISKTNKLTIPKILDWYLLDFAKDLDALMDWVCLQLPDQLRKEAVARLERRGREPLAKLVQVTPFDYRFRYLIQR